MADLDLKQLSKIIDLCRKKGVDSIEFDGIRVVLGHAPTPVKRKPRGIHAVPDSEVEIEDQFSEEQTLFWSSGGLTPTEGAS